MTIKEELTATFEGLCEWHQERSILETTELICEIMEKAGISRVQLAERLGKSKGFISQLLDGTANMTIRTMSDMFVALGYQFHPSTSPLSEQPPATVNTTDVRQHRSVPLLKTQLHFSVGGGPPTIPLPFAIGPS